MVLGECRGEEIADLLRALNSGHHGGMTTLHADGVARVPARMEALGLLAGLAPQALAMLTAGAFDVVLHLERRNGRRYIGQIGCLVYDRGSLSGVPIAAWDGRRAAYAPEWEPFRRRWMAAGS